MRSASLLVLLASLIWIAGPAGSEGHSSRSTFDFTQPVPASTQLRAPSHRSRRVADRHNGYGVEGPILYRSVPVRAPRRFDVVGVAGQVHALEFRARRDGEPWSDWVETDNGDPVYTGGTDQVQVRSRTVPIAGELHYVRIAGDATAPAQRLLAGGTPKSPPEPDFITRAQWGANAPVGGCQPRVEPELGRVKAGVVHHTVSTNTYTEAEAPAIVLGICRYHRNANGWNDIGYNALVDRFGNLYEGRAGGLTRPVVGAQAEGVNSQTTGIASIGDHRDKPATPAERRAIVGYLAWKFDLAGIAASGRATLLSAGGTTQRTPAGQRVKVPLVFSHSDTNYTECAGEALRAQIPQIRHAVQRRLDHFGDDPADPVDPTVPGGSAP